MRCDIPTFAAFGPHAVLDAYYGFDERGGGEDPAGLAASLTLCSVSWDRWMGKGKGKHGRGRT